MVLWGQLSGKYGEHVNENNNLNDILVLFRSHQANAIIYK